MVRDGDESEESEKDGEIGDNSKAIYDSDGNELVEHVSKNTMNDMLPINVKAA